jgi:alginate O-acetyltransferase complex protein AlgI
MLFNSYEFVLVFLPVVLAGFFLTGRYSPSLGVIWLVLASFFFYGWWNVNFVGLLAASVVFNYAAGWAIHRGRTRGSRWSIAFLTVAVAVNLLVLGYFKYANFFISNVDALANMNLPLVNVVLPLGISFFTFTQIAYLVDVYRRLAEDMNPFRYVLFVTYFPHLIAGPLLHHKQVMPQFQTPATFRPNPNFIAAGLTLFTIGLAKKVLIADGIAGYSNTLFEAARDGLHLKMLAAWTATLAYTAQLYFDFSGYSDMAIGLSLLFGVTLPINFNSPYKAPNMIEFWRRWHITLALFLRDYLYIPLGGNRYGYFRRYLNLLVTMLLGGLWHGANWTFLVWGALHGLYLIIAHAWQHMREHFKLRPRSTWFGRAVATLITFLAVVFAWVYFRADTIEVANRIVAGMVGLNGFSFDDFSDNQLGSPRLVLLAFGICAFAVFVCPNSQEILAAIRLKLHESWAVGVVCGVLAAFCLITLRNVKSDFLYFQF